MRVSRGVLETSRNSRREEHCTASSLQHQYRIVSSIEVTQKLMRMRCRRVRIKTGHNGTRETVLLLWQRIQFRTSLRVAQPSLGPTLKERLCCRSNEIKSIRGRQRQVRVLLHKEAQLASCFCCFMISICLSKRGSTYSIYLSIAA